MSRPRLIVFASGTQTGGGTGFENLVKHSRGGDLDADIVAVVSNHEHGGVRSRADRLGVRFIHIDPSEHSHILKNVRVSYQEVVERFGAEWVALSGWMKKTQGLDPCRTINIHPALLLDQNGRFGGKGMYGHRIHEAVKAALDAGEITESGCSMHFVTDEYDRGPVFFEYRIPLTPDMSADDIAQAVNRVEHVWQPRLTHLVVHGLISWDGRDPLTLKKPDITA